MLKKYRYVVPMFVLLFYGMECFAPPGDVDPEAAAAKVEEGNTALEDELYAFINAMDDDDIDHPADIDFTLSNSLYREAIDLDPENVDARFGAGLTEMLVFTQDPDVQDVFDAWSAFMDTGQAFIADSVHSPGSALMRLLSAGMFGTPTGIIGEQEVAHALLNLYKLSVSDPPTFEDIQVVIENEFIPRLGC